MTQRIKTNIKFKRGDRDELYGFVTKIGSSWRGCHEEDDVKKRIVYVDRDVQMGMEPDLLYKVTLIPMTKKDGFIAISAHQVKFSAKIKTELDDDKFKVTVSFGHKTLTYSPMSKSKKHSDMNAIANLIRDRKDLEGSMQVAEDFLDNATMALVLYKRAKEG